MPYLDDEQLLRLPFRFMLPHLKFPEIEEACELGHGPTMAQVFKLFETTKGEMNQRDSVYLAGEMQLPKVSLRKAYLNESD